MSLKIKTSEDCRWDAIALGEVMLRLDPGFGRIRTAREFTVWEGGGEYNVVRGLSRCFGMRTGVVTAIVDNEIGHLLEGLMLSGGVDISHVKWVPFDGIGRDARVGLNFTEKGYGVRPALGCSDRANSAASKINSGDVNWTEIFSAEGSRWFHTGGIFAALSDSASEVALEAIEAAQKAGTIVSYDLNYRDSLWKSRGGNKAAAEVNRKIVFKVDILIGNEEDFISALGFNVTGLDPNLLGIDASNFKKMIKDVVTEFPNLKLVATTLRTAKTANMNDWGAIIYADGEYFEATPRKDLEIYDRIGGGDSFASGLIFALLSGKGYMEAVEYGAAHGALAMTTPGDTSMATLKEVEALMKGKGARVMR
jgi:2-dehydro-3-deoxygluconokinase